MRGAIHRHVAASPSTAGCQQPPTTTFSSTILCYRPALPYHHHHHHYHHDYHHDSSKPLSARHPPTSMLRRPPHACFSSDAVRPSRTSTYDRPENPLAATTHRPPPLNKSPEVDPISAFAERGVNSSGALCKHRQQCLPSTATTEVSSYTSALSSGLPLTTSSPGLQITRIPPRARFQVRRPRRMSVMRVWSCSRA